MLVRRHPVLLARHVGMLLVGAVLLLGARNYLPPVGFVREVRGTLLLALLARTGWKAAAWNVERFIVTDQRILLVSGLLTREVSVLPLRKVTDMSYQRSLAGQLLGYGEFIMESASEAQGLRRVRFLPRPDHLYLQISALLFGGGTRVTGLRDDSD